MNHWDEPGGPLTDADLAKVKRQTYGLGGLGQWYPSSNELNYLPGMSFSDVPNAAGFSYDSRTPIHGATTIFTFIDNITKVHGRHTFKAGVTIMRTRAWKGNQGNNFSGAFQFGKDVNNPLDTNYAYANAIQGIYDTYQEASAKPGADFRSVPSRVCTGFVEGRPQTHAGIRNALHRMAPWFQRSCNNRASTPAHGMPRMHRSSTPRPQLRGSALSSQSGDRRAIARHGLDRRLVPRWVARWMVCAFPPTPVSCKDSPRCRPLLPVRDSAPTTRSATGKPRSAAASALPCCPRRRSIPACNRSRRTPTGRRPTTAR